MIRASLLALALLAAAGAPAQDAALPPAATWVVIFDHETTDHANQPVTINLRMLVRARREGEAVLTAARVLTNLTNTHVAANFRFVEAQQRPPGDK